MLKQNLFTGTLFKLLFTHWSIPWEERDFSGSQGAFKLCLDCRVYNTQCWETMKNSRDSSTSETLKCTKTFKLTLVTCIWNSCHINNSKTLVFSSIFCSFLVILFPHCSNSPSENQTFFVKYFLASCSTSQLQCHHFISLHWDSLYHVISPLFTGS